MRTGLVIDLLPAATASLPAVPDDYPVLSILRRYVT